MSNNLYETIGTATVDRLFAGNEITPIVKPVTLAKNKGVFARGTVLGIEAGVCAVVNSKNADGTKAPYAILAQTTDTTGSEDAAASAYFTGVFNSAALVFGGDDTVETHEAALRGLGIHLKTTVPY